MDTNIKVKCRSCEKEVNVGDLVRKDNSIICAQCSFKTNIEPTQKIQEEKEGTRLYLS